MKLLTDESVQFLNMMATNIRGDIIDMLLAAGSGHTAGPLGMADIFTFLYFYALKHDPNNPLWEERDRVVLSNGHICPVQYAAMARSGYFPIEELKTLRKLHSRLQGHPQREYLPGIEVTSGPLGLGLSQAVGMALDGRIQAHENPHYIQPNIFCLMSDGEQESGIVWEAAMLAGRERLHTIIGIIDRNNIQIDGFVHDVMPSVEPLAEKWRSFGWHVVEIDGHNFYDIYNGVSLAQSMSGMPSVIIAHTVPGKGVPEYERDFRLHGYPPDKKQAAEVLHRLRTLNGAISSEHQ